MHNILEHAKETHMPSKTVQLNKRKHKKSKWITFGIIKSINYRDDLYKKLKMTHPEAIQYTALKTNLDTYNNILKKSIWLQKKLYYEACFEKYKHDIKKMWKTINEVLNNTRKKRTFPEYFKNENEQITDKLVIANQFNSFFL